MAQTPRYLRYGRSTEESDRRLGSHSNQEETISISVPDKDHEGYKRNSYSMDLTQSIRVMTLIFSASDRLTGEETEPFMHRLQPILDQMQASQIPEQHHVTAFFSLLTGKAKESASKIRAQNISLQEFVTEIANDLVFEHKIQQRKMNRWKAITFSEFLSKTETCHEAVRACIEHLTSHQKDLSAHHCTDRHLLEHLREVFEYEDWCTTLYEQDLPTMFASAFGNRLLTAASRHDSRKKRPSTPHNSSTYHVLAPPATTTQAQPSGSNLSHIIAAFFAKTPPLPRQRRPYRFRGYHQSRRPYRPTYGHSRTPEAIRRTSQRLCYACSQSGHIVRNCPEKAKYLQNLHRLHQAGTGAHLILEQMDTDPSSELEEVVHFVNDYFATEDEQDTEFDTWICDLMNTIDQNTFDDKNEKLPTPYTMYHSSQSGHHVKFSIRDLQQAMREMMVHNANNIVQHLLIDPGAPRDMQ